MLELQCTYSSSCFNWRSCPEFSRSSWLMLVPLSNIDSEKLPGNVRLLVTAPGQVSSPTSPGWFPLAVVSGPATARWHERLLSSGTLDKITGVAVGPDICRSAMFKLFRFMSLLLMKLCEWDQRKWKGKLKKQFLIIDKKKVLKLKQPNNNV